MTKAILMYADSVRSLTPSGFIAVLRDCWTPDSVKSRINEMAKLKLLERTVVGEPRRGIESQYVLTKAGEERLSELENVNL